MVKEKGEEQVVGQYAYQILSERLDQLERVISDLVQFAHKHEQSEEGEDSSSDFVKPVETEVPKTNVDKVKKFFGV